MHNLSFNGTSNTYPVAKIYASIKALQKLKIENILHLPSEAKRTYHPTEDEIFMDISEEKSIILQNIPHKPENFKNPIACKTYNGISKPYKKSIKPTL